MTTRITSLMAALTIAASSPVILVAQADVRGPVGPSPYDIVRGWHQPFAEPGYAFGGNSGVFAESPDRIFVAQRGETRLPDPVPDGFEQHAGSIGINVLREADRRIWQHCLYTLNRHGEVSARDRTARVRTGYESARTTRSAGCGW
jgi:hypothetical protein